MPLSAADVEPDATLQPEGNYSSLRDTRVCHEGGVGCFQRKRGEAATDVHFIEHTSTSEEHKLATDP